jgi:UDPglucose 6-dehydrogenase
MNICVVGTGYVGLVAGTCFAESGHEVVCVDVDEEKIAKLNGGVIPIFEPGLEDLVKRNMEEGRLSFTTDLAQGVRDSRVLFIAVGTPQDRDGSADLSSVMEVARQIGRAMNGYKIIVDKSTVPVGTADKVRAMVASQTKHKFAVVSNPEFMKEGAAVQDFMKPDRVVIGTDSPKVAEEMKELYAPFVRTEKPILVMGVRSAEMTKYASNALLATKISFMNEIANLCDAVGADVDEVRKGVGSDSRIGFPFLFPGVGYGGSCFPKDVRALMRTAEEASARAAIVAAVDRANERQKTVLLDKILRHFKNNVRGRLFAVWGLAFKPQTDDMREAPSIPLVQGLLRRGARVHAYDPAAAENAEKIFGGKIKLFETGYDALHDADALVIVTEWHEFRRPNYDKMKKMMKRPLIFDGRNIYTPQVMREMGFTYYSIGRDA